MPYKIVKTFEKGNSKLSAVPGNWEKDGVLHWPKYNENKLRRIENSYPENSWRKMNCKVKRSNFNTLFEAEQEIDKMCNKSETEPDTEQYYVTNQKEMMFNQIVQDCIMNENISSGALNNTVGPVEMKENQHLQARNSKNLLMAVQSPAINKDFNVLQNVTQPDEATNSNHTLLVIQPPSTSTDPNSDGQQNLTQPDEETEHTLLYIQPSATSTDSNAQQNVTAEIQIDNAASLNLMVLAKLETLQENYQTLNEKITESIKAQQEERKIIHENVQSMLLGLSNISVQFEYVMNQFSRVENHKQNENIQTITSEEDLNNFEKVLEDQEKEEEWKKKFSIICGKGKGRGVNNAYALIDSMFSRSFLLQCSWAGGSRTSDQKISFKSHTKIINFFFDIIRESDSSFSLLDCHKFFKNILKNSRQRNESKQERTSRTKNRPKIKAKRKNLCNKTQPSLPIAGTSTPENSSGVSLPAVGTSGSGSENHSEVVLENPGPDNDDNDPMSSASVAEIPTKPLETSV